MRIIIIFLLILTTNCSSNKVSKNHGFRSLETQIEKLVLNKSNKNDVVKLIGPPSYKSNFDENKWIFIERKHTNNSLIKLGLKKIEKNNVLVLEFNNVGILQKKIIIDKNQMNEIQYVEKITDKKFDKDNFLYDVFTSLREKINAPARNRIKK